VRGSNCVLNAVIQNLKNRKSRLYKKWASNKTPENFNALKSVSRELNYNIKLERRKWIDKGLKGDSKQYWTTINSLLGKSIGENSEIIDTAGITHVDDHNKANAFANFFSDKIESLTQASEPDNFVLPDLSAGVGAANENFLATLTSEGVSIWNIKSK